MTQKSRGKYIGKVIKSIGNTITIKGNIPLSAGDGLCYFDSKGRLEGCMVNKVENNKIWLNKSIDIADGTKIYRNNDYLFEKKLQNKSSERKISISLTLVDTDNGFCLTAIDEDVTTVCYEKTMEKTHATSPEKATEQICKQLSKTGDTPFETTNINIECTTNYFIPTFIINDMRRNVLEKLIVQRLANAVPLPHITTSNDVPYIKDQIDYKENVINRYSEQFYTRHGATTTEYGLERTKNYTDKALMTTKYCIRYEIGQCLKRHEVSELYKGNLYIKNNKNIYRLQFNCNECEMQIFLSDKKL